MAPRRGGGTTSGKKEQADPVIDDSGNENNDNSVTAGKVPVKKATDAAKKKQPAKASPAAAATSAQNDAPDEETAGPSNPIKMPNLETAAPLQRPPVTEFIKQVLQKLKPTYQPRTRTVEFTFRGVVTTTDVGNDPRTLKEDYDAWEEEKNAMVQTGNATGPISTLADRSEAMTYYQRARVIAIEQTAPLDVLRALHSSAKESGHGTTSTGNKVTSSTSVDPNQPYTRAKEKARVSLASNPVLLGQVYKEIDQFNDRPQRGSFATNGFVRSAKASLEKAKAALRTGAAWEHHMPARATLLAIKFCDPNERINPTIGGLLSELGKADILNITQADNVNSNMLNLQNAVVNLQDREAARSAAGGAPVGNTANSRKRKAAPKEVTLVNENVDAKKIRLDMDAKFTAMEAKFKASEVKHKAVNDKLLAKLEDLTTAIGDLNDKMDAMSKAREEKELYFADQFRIMDSRMAKLEGAPVKVVDDADATGGTGDPKTGNKTATPAETGEKENGDLSLENQDVLTGI
ncbi:hypothetical protein SUNI508_03270 [Seiridium unicorne]|uniref:Uncharacterized protein n=1 Tax=Seiridium unicorne TaxID=138068 RepID=A0ABR2VFA9_9PEZI